MSQVNFERVLTGWSGSADGTADGIALKMFSGMVLEAFQQSTHFYDRTSQFISVKQLEGANSAQWPILGDDPTPAYHSPGTFLNAFSSSNVRQIKTSSVDVVVDEILTTSLDVPFRDMSISHFDVLGPFATKLGRAISKVLDKKIAVLAVKAARTAAVSGIHGGGYVVYRDDGSSTTSGNADVTAAYPVSPAGAYNFRTDVASLAQSMDEKNVPEGSRYLFITPHIKSVLRFEANWSGSAIIGANAMPSTYDRAYSAQPNDVNARVVGMLEGFKVIVTNHLPSADLSVNSLTGENAAIAYTSGTATTSGKYQDFFNGPYNATTATAKARARPVAVALCGADTGSPAIGMVQASGLRSYMEADERRNTQFLKSQIMCGLGVICPWSAGSIEVFRDGA
jgi:hypothetical protein